MATSIHPQGKTFPEVVVLETDGNTAYLQQKQKQDAPVLGFIEVEAKQGSKLIEELFVWLLGQDIVEAEKLLLRLGKHHDENRG